MAEKDPTPLPSWVTDLYESVNEQWHKDNKNYLPLNMLETYIPQFGSGVF
jgi:hypothetical protein